MGIPAKVRTKRVAVQEEYGQVLTLQGTRIEAAWMICDSVMRNAPSHRAINPFVRLVLSYLTDPLAEGARDGPSVKFLTHQHMADSSVRLRAPTRVVFASASGVCGSAPSCASPFVVYS